MINTLEDFQRAFSDIMQMGWIRTHRSGDTGVGKTLEDLLGIEENNLAMADFGVCELKAQRASATSMLTLFTKSPEPRGINTLLRETFGYASNAYANDRKVLHATLYTGRPAGGATPCQSLQIGITDERIRIMSGDTDTGAYWTMETIRNKIATKYPEKLVYVTAQSRGSGRDEEFLFKSAIAVSNITFNSIMSLFREDKIVLDIRIGQYPDGRTHDHGSGFRLRQAYFPELFAEHIRLD